MLKHAENNNDPRGIVLLVTMVVLVVLASIACMLTLRISAQIHRDRYIIDYQNARYACDSALKYTIVNMSGIKINLIDRPNEPDFSDVFALTQDDYDRFLAKWASRSPSGSNEQQFHARIAIISAVSATRMQIGVCPILTTQTPSGILPHSGTLIIPIRHTGPATPTR